MITKRDIDERKAEVAKMSDAIARIEQVQASAKQTPSGEGAVVLSMIDKLMARPDVPVEKLEQLFALHQKVQADAARKVFLIAFAGLQKDLPTAARGGKGHNSKAYARYEDVAAAVRDPFSRHGFSHWFAIDQTGNHVKIITCLGHEGGHVETTSISLPVDTSGNKNPVQAVGSTVSYGKRYGLLTITGIATDDDDDGHKGGDNSEAGATVADITNLIKITDSSLAWFLNEFCVEALDDLTASQRAKCKTLLLNKQAKQRKAAKS